MSKENPYRYLGTIDGPTYVERAADRKLLEVISRNDSYAYFLAPRQSGKSSLILHTINKLSNRSDGTAGLQGVLIDLTSSEFSPVLKNDYSTFLEVLLSLIFKELGLRRKQVPKSLNDAFDFIEANCAKRVIIFLDEIDWLLNTNFKDDFLANLRARFNSRPDHDRSDYLQIILSGSVSSTFLISDQKTSPLNVADEIELEDLSIDELKVLCGHLKKAGIDDIDEVAARLWVYTRGSVYLSQLVLKSFWERELTANINKDIGLSEIDEICFELGKNGKPGESHFLNIQNELISNDLLESAQAYLEGKDVGSAHNESLKLTGLFTKNRSFRNRIYQMVFDSDGPLPLFKRKQRKGSVSNIKKVDERHLILSYAHSDRCMAMVIRLSLMEQGYEVWMADRELRDSVDWAQTILNVLDDADGMVLVWSQAAKDSKDVFEEIRIGRVFQKPIYPILAHSMRQIPKLPEEIGTLQVIIDSDFDDRIVNLGNRILRQTENVMNYPELAKHGYIPRSPNPYFVGRNEELKGLFVDTRGFHGETRKRIPIAISGLAGIGKTHLALTFAFRFNLFFPSTEELVDGKPAPNAELRGGVYWIDAPNGIIKEFTKLGRHLGLGRLRDEPDEDYGHRVYEKLCDLKNGLVIFDNVTAFEEFKEWCPEGNKCCSVILTSRKRITGFPVRTIILPELDVNSAQQLILSRREDRQELLKDEKQLQAIKQICEIMGNHPLALEQCASYLQLSIVDPIDFLHDLQKEENPFSHLAKKDEFRILLKEGETNLLEILHRNYESLDSKEIDPYFLILCWFSPYEIKEDLVVNAYKAPNEAKKILQKLSNSSLIYSEAKTVTMHPLVSQFGRSLDRSRGGIYRKKFTEIIFNFLEKNRDEQSVENVRTEVPHILQAITIAKEDKNWSLIVYLQTRCSRVVDNLEEKVERLSEAFRITETRLSDKTGLPDLSFRLAQNYRDLARYKKALSEFQNARKLYDDFKIGQGHKTILLQLEIGYLQLELANYKEAQTCLDKALDLALNELGYDEIAPEVTQIQRAMARILLAQGNLEVASEKFRNVLNLRQEYSDNQADFPATEALATSYTDLAEVSLQKGDFKSAVASVQKAQGLFKSNRKEKEPSNGELHLLLGKVFSESCDYEEAKKEIEQAGQIFKTIFGERHPHFARTLIAESELSRRLGNFTDAQEKIETAVSILQNRFQKEHPSVAEALGVKGKILDHLGLYDEEKEVWDEVLRIQKKAYSTNPNHLALAMTHYDYASLYLNKGDYKEAKNHLEDSLRITKEGLGTTQHPEYLGRLIRLADCLYQQQEYQEAQTLLKEADEVRKEVFRDTPHPYVGRMLQLQSEVHRRLGRFKEAYESIEEAKAVKKELYGESHPSYAEALEVEVKVYHYLGKITGVKELIDKSLKIRKDHYGESHPAVGRSEHDLGAFYFRTGHYEKSIAHFTTARKIGEAKFGKNHRDYIERSLYLCNALTEQGSYPMALKEIEDLEQVIGLTIKEGNHFLKARWLQYKAELQRRLGNFRKAMELIEDAIAMKKEVYHSAEHPSVARSLSVKGKILDHLGLYDEEKEVWDEVLRIQKKAYSTNPNHLALAMTHYDYASLYLNKGDYKEAKNHLEDSLRITKEGLGTTQHPEYLGRLVLLANCLYQQQDYQEAQTLLKEADEVRKKVFGNAAHPYVGRMLQLQSEVYRRLGDFKEALTSIEEAKAVKKELYGESHPSYAEALEVQVDLYLSQYPLEASRPLLDRIERIRKDTYGSRHPFYSNSQLREAQYYIIKGEYHLAGEMLSASMKIYEQYEAAHPEVIKRHVLAARLARLESNIEKARANIEQAIKALGTRMQSENSFSVISVLEESANIYRKQSDYRASLQQLEMAISKTDNCLGKDSYSALEMNIHKVKLLLVMDRHAEATNDIDSALNVLTQKWPMSLRLRADYLEQKGILITHNGKPEEAIAFFDQAIEIKVGLFGNDHIELAKLFLDKAAAMRAIGEYGEALKLVNDALNIDNEKVLDSNHVFFARIFLENGKIYYGQQRYLAAQEQLDEALDVYRNQTIIQDHKEYVSSLMMKGLLFIVTDFAVEAHNQLTEAIKNAEKIYDLKHPVIIGLKKVLTATEGEQGDKIETLEQIAL